jgi:hypothetical protein
LAKEQLLLLFDGDISQKVDYSGVNVDGLKGDWNRLLFDVENESTSDRTSSNLVLKRHFQT